MSATIETLDGLERRITLSLNIAEIDAEVDKRLRQVARNVKMDGFRPGKAPMNMVAARYGAEVRGEVLSDVLQQRFTDEVQAQNIEIAGYPRFAPAGGEAFTATFEVMPVISIGDVGQIQVDRPVVDVGDADVDRTLDVLRKQRVQYHAVERPSRNGDRLHIDYQGKIDGVAFQGGEARDFPVILGEGRTLADFEGNLVDMAAGASKTFDVSFPEDYFAKELAGKTATFEAWVKSVHEPVLPELDEAFAHSLGVHEGGSAKLRDEIGANLRREAKRRIQLKVREQVMDGLLAASPFDVPKVLVATEMRAMLERAVGDLKARGLKEQDIKLTPEVFEAQARRRVALGLLLSGFAEANNVTAGDDQIRAKVEEFAQSYEDPSEVVAWYYQNAERMNEVRAMVIEDNIVDMILGRAQVIDAPTTLEQLMGNA
jgi:trigger factor